MRGKSGSRSACPIGVFCRIHLQLAMGPVIMLQAVWYRVDYLSLILTLMLLTAKLAWTKLCKNPEKPLKPLANGYSSESAQQELSNEYQHDRILMVLKNLCIFVLWAKVATALEGLSDLPRSSWGFLCLRDGAGCRSRRSPQQHCPRPDR